jgi:TolB protein
LCHPAAKNGADGSSKSAVVRALLLVALAAGVLTVALGAPNAQKAPRTARQGAKPDAKEDDLFEITVAAKGRSPYRIAVPAAYGNDAPLGALVHKVAKNNLRIATAFKILKQKTYPRYVRSEKMTLHATDWAKIGAQGVMKYKVDSNGGTVNIQFMLWETAKGDTPVLTSSISTRRPLIRMAVHEWCNKVMKHYTGVSGAFGTWLSFVASVGTKRKDVYVMQHDGYGLRRVSKPKSLNILPSWSPDGKNLVFTSYVRRNPDLYIVPFSGRRKPRRVSKRRNLNSGAAWSPDGKKVAITLAKDGNSEIYLLSPLRYNKRRGWRIKRRLTRHSGIDTSPTWSPDSKRIVWVSNRYGRPQLWIMNADGSKKKRLTRRGYYNQTPTWCPKKKSPLIAFTSRKSGRFSIFIYNVRTRTYRRITGRRHGNNEEPTWAPNCQLLAFASSRGGIWVSNLDGTAQTRIYKGKALQPSWGPWDTLK